MFIVLPYGETKRLTMGKSRIKSVGRFRFLIFEHPFPSINKVAPYPRPHLLDLGTSVVKVINMREKLIK